MKRIISLLICCLLLSSICFVEANAASIKLNKTKISLKSGKTFQLKLNGAKGKIKWKSSKKTIASVNSKGKVTGKKSGKAKITATYKGKSYKCSVNVKKVTIKKISLNKSKLTINKGKTATLKCTVKPKTASNKKLKWTSSNKNVATVDSKGKITAKKSGFTTITVATTDGTKLKTKCTVTVLNLAVNATIKSNLNTLKEYILNNGDTNINGDAGIFGEYSDDESVNKYCILYLPKEKMFRFVWSDDYSDEPDEYNIGVSLSFNYSLTGFDYITAEFVNVYYEYENPSASYSTEIIANVETYNNDSTIPSINVKSNTYSLSTEKIKDYTNSDFKLAMTQFNNLLYSETGFTLSDIGFKNFN